MLLKSPLLYIVFIKGDVASQRLEEAAEQPWTAPKDAKPGDVALFYFGGSDPGLHAVGKTATPAEAGVPGDWTHSEHGFFARHAGIKRLHRPISLREIRAAFPTWGRWKSLRGVRVNIVPLQWRDRLAAMIGARNPSARPLLSTWLPVSTQPPEHEPPPRPLVSVRRHLRDSSFGKRVRRASQGRCAVCVSPTDYDRLGILEAAHIRSVEEGGPDELTNALALCPNHHALFDEGRWTLDGDSILLDHDLPREIVALFRRRTSCAWQPDVKELEWHRKNVFRRGAG
jgi:HNH endonuclease